MDTDDTSHLGERMKPKTSKDAAELAEAFLTAHHPVKDFLPAKSHPPTSSGKPVGGNEYRAKNYKHSFFPTNTVSL